MKLIYKSKLGNVRFDGIKATYCCAEDFGRSHRGASYASRKAGRIGPGQWAEAVPAIPGSVKRTTQYWELNDGRVVHFDGEKHVDNLGVVVTKTVGKE